MEQVARKDPYFEEMKRLEEGEKPPHGKTLPAIIDSPHLWRGRLPKGMEPGVHLIEVRETDMWGREHLGRRSIRVFAQ